MLELKSCQWRILGGWNNSVLQWTWKILWAIPFYKSTSLETCTVNVLEYNILESSSFCWNCCYLPNLDLLISLSEATFDRFSIIQFIMDSLMWPSFLGEMRGLRTSIFALLYLQVKVTTKYNSNVAWRFTGSCREKYQKYCCYTLKLGWNCKFFTFISATIALMWRTLGMLWVLWQEENAILLVCSYQCEIDSFLTNLTPFAF